MKFLSTLIALLFLAVSAGAPVAMADSDKHGDSHKVEKKDHEDQGRHMGESKHDDKGDDHGEMKGDDHGEMKGDDHGDKKHGHDN